MLSVDSQAVNKCPSVVVVRRFLIEAGTRRIFGERLTRMKGKTLRRNASAPNSDQISGRNGNLQATRVETKEEIFKAIQYDRSKISIGSQVYVDEKRNIRFRAAPNSAATLSMQSSHVNLVEQGD
jgi:hypothetical protein